MKKEDSLIKCDFCGKDADGYIDFHWEEIVKLKEPIEVGYRYPCCLECRDKMLPFTSVPMARILKEGIFKTK